MPATIVVTCAGCGRRYKGVPGSRGYKCAHCNNALTFPRMPRSALPGKALCSNCWRGVEAGQRPTICPSCKQLVGTRDGGRATLPGLFANAADPVPIDNQDEQLLSTERDLKARIVAAQAAVTLADRAAPPATTEAGQAGQELQAAGKDSGTPELRNEPLVQHEKPPDPWLIGPGETLAARVNKQDRTAAESSGSLHEAVAQRQDAPPPSPPYKGGDWGGGGAPGQSPRDESRPSLEQLQAEKAQLQKELGQLRETAVKTLEPLSEEYARRLQDMMLQTDRANALVEEVRLEVNRRLEAVETAVRELRSQLAAAGQEMNERLAKVIGTRPQNVEVMSVPALASNAPFAELLAAALPPGAVVTVSRHAPEVGA